MLIDSIYAVFDPVLLNDRVADYLLIEWYEADKRIIRRKTAAGLDVAIKRTVPFAPLQHHDILFYDQETVILIAIQPCECIVVYPRNALEIGAICYDIGNKHIPLALSETEIVMPFDKPAFCLLEKNGFNIKTESRIFSNQLRSNIPQHGHQSDSLLEKLIKLTS